MCFRPVLRPKTMINLHIDIISYFRTEDVSGAFDNRQVLNTCYLDFDSLTMTRVTDLQLEVRD